MDNICWPFLWGCSALPETNLPLPFTKQAPIYSPVCSKQFLLLLCPTSWSLVPLFSKEFTLGGWGAAEGRLRGVPIIWLSPVDEGTPHKVLFADIISDSLIKPCIDKTLKYIKLRASEKKKTFKNSHRNFIPNSPQKKYITLFLCLFCFFTMGKRSSTYFAIMLVLL